jgi:hypothetical protein
VIAILNHMPLWAGASTVAAIVVGYLAGTWLRSMVTQAVAKTGEEPS